MSFFLLWVNKVINLLKNRIKFKYYWIFPKWVLYELLLLLLTTVKPPYNVNFGASWKFVLYEVSCYMKVVPILYPKNSASLVLLTFWTRLRRSYSCMISFFFFKDIDCLLRFSCWTVLDEAIFRVRRKEVNFARLPELLTTFCLW